MAIDKQVPADLDVHLVMDNYGTHKTQVVKKWFARHPRFHVHLTPTSASWLNQVERWLATLTEKQIRRGTHRLTQQIDRAIRDYLETYNADPKPFVWSKTADEIFASIQRFCMRIAASVHESRVQLIAIPGSVRRPRERVWRAPRLACLVSTFSKECYLNRCQPVQPLRMSVVKSPACEHRQLFELTTGAPRPPI